MTSTSASIGGGGSGGARARFRRSPPHRQDVTAATTAADNAQHVSSASSSCNADANFSSPLHQSASHSPRPHKKIHKPRQQQQSRVKWKLYRYPCLVAAAAIIVLLVDMRFSPRSNMSPIQPARSRNNEKNNRNRNSNNYDQQQAAVRGSGATPSRLRTTFADNNKEELQQQYPIEISLNSVGMINGRKALGVGSRVRPHTDSEGNALSWWTPKNRINGNYNDLEIIFLGEDSFRRQIRPVPDGESEYYGSYEVWDSDYDDMEEEQMGIWKQYRAMDDDAVRSEVYTSRNDNTECRIPEWYRLQFPSCNKFHEMPMIHSDANNTFLGRGFYRMVFSIEERDQPWYVLKVLRWQEGGKKQDENLFRPSPSMIEKTRLDALVMERLSFSPRIADIYGFCSTSIMTEPLPGEILKEAVPTERVIAREELVDKEDVVPKNPYTPTEKIEMALEMAEALADLHGFKDGIIVHDDLDLGQYLRTRDGRLKLNDFNRAKPLLYDSVKGEHCKYYNGPIGGKFRAPEEFVPTVLDEKIDIFSLGNCFYGLLTGLWPLYYSSNEIAENKLVMGQMPYIDKRYRTRSYAEGALVKAIEMCHHREPEDRSDIFAIVKHLRDAVEVNAEHASR